MRQSLDLRVVARATLVVLAILATMSTSAAAGGVVVGGDNIAPQGTATASSIQNHITTAGSAEDRARAECGPMPNANQCSYGDAPCATALMWKALEIHKCWMHVLAASEG